MDSRRKLIIPELLKGESRDFLDRIFEKSQSNILKVGKSVTTPNRWAVSKPPSKTPRSIKSSWFRRHHWVYWEKDSNSEIKVSKINKRRSRVWGIILDKVKRKRDMLGIKYW